MAVHSPLVVAVEDLKALRATGQGSAPSDRAAFHAAGVHNPQKTKVFTERPLKWTGDCLVGTQHGFAVNHLGFPLANCSVSPGRRNQSAVGF